MDCAEESVAKLLDAMFAAVESAGVPRESLTLNVSNVVVEPPDDGEEMLHPAIGEYVALSVLAPLDLGPDATWHPGKTGPNGLLLQIQSALRSTSTYAYVRRLSTYGSVTVFLPGRRTK